jgi:hypothetical protein
MYPARDASGYPVCPRHGGQLRAASSGLSPRGHRHPAHTAGGAGKSRTVQRDESPSALPDRVAPDCSSDLFPRHVAEVKRYARSRSVASTLRAKKRASQWGVFAVIPDNLLTPICQFAYMPDRFRTRRGLAPNRTPSLAVGTSNSIYGSRLRAGAAAHPTPRFYGPHASTPRRNAAMDGLTFRAPSSFLAWTRHILEMTSLNVRYGRNLKPSPFGRSSPLHDPFNGSPY